MTTEQKAKAYDEALEAARKELNQDLHESGVWAIQRIFPELRESEDERIRKWLLECVENLSDGNFIEVSRQDVLAYLEKQKDSKVCEEKSKNFTIQKEQKLSIVEKLREISTPADEDWFEIQKRWEKEDEQKSAQTDDEKEYIRTTKSIIADFIRDKQPEDVSFYQKIYDWLDGRHIEQKAAEGKYYSSPECGTTAGVWSEEDEEMLDLVIGDVTDAKKNFVSKDAKDCCDREIAWLKSLRPSWKPSEEQEPDYYQHFDPDC